MSSSARLLDRENQIIEIVWKSNTKPEDVDRVTNEVKNLAKELGKEFDVIVDMRGMSAFSPEARERLVVHQKEIINVGMKRAAVVVLGTLSKYQLSRSAKEAENTVESHWNSYEEAIEFLKNTK